MRREKQEGRRMIFLNDDEILSGFRGKITRRNANLQGPRTKCQAQQATYTSHTKREETSTVRQFRITTAPSHRYNVDPAELITISDDEEEIPPPPPLQTISSPHEETRGESHEQEGIWSKTPSPPLIGNISVEDLIIDPDILDDPLVLEFRRTYLGRTDTTVDIRSPTPPSPFPPSSPSSIDWENENYRPPTPPRPKRYASFEIEDRQFPYLGLHCYERVWRARILVPRKHAPYALPEPTQYQTPDQRDPCESNEWQNEEHHLGAPPTPGRGWLSQSFDQSPSPIPSPPPFAKSPSPTPSPPPFVKSPSPVPSPPPLVIPPPPTVPYECLITPSQGSLPESPLLEELPAEMQQTLRRLQEEYKGRRLRTIQEIWGQRYRITFKANGELIITLA